MPSGPAGVSGSACPCLTPPGYSDSLPGNGRFALGEGLNACRHHRDHPGRNGGANLTVGFCVFAHFYVVLGATARIFLVATPVESTHPHEVFSFVSNSVDTQCVPYDTSRSDSPYSRTSSDFRELRPETALQPLSPSLNGISGRELGILPVPCPGDLVPKTRLDARPSFLSLYGPLLDFQKIRIERRAHAHPTTLSASVRQRVFGILFVYLDPYRAS